MGPLPLRFKTQVVTATSVKEDKEHLRKVRVHIVICLQELCQADLLRYEGVQRILNVGVSDECDTGLTWKFLSHDQRGLPSDLLVLRLGLHLHQVSIRVSVNEICLRVGGMKSLLANEGRLLVDIRRHFIRVKIARVAPIRGGMLIHSFLTQNFQLNGGAKGLCRHHVSICKRRLLVRFLSRGYRSTLPRERCQGVRRFHVVAVRVRNCLEVRRHCALRFHGSVTRLHEINFRRFAPNEGVRR